MNNIGDYIAVNDYLERIFRISEIQEELMNKGYITITEKEMDALNSKLFLHKIGAITTAALGLLEQMKSLATSSSTKLESRE